MNFGTECKGTTQKKSQSENSHRSDFIASSNRASYAGTLLELFVEFLPQGRETYARLPGQPQRRDSLQVVALLIPLPRISRFRIKHENLRNPNSHIVPTLLK